MSHGTKLLIFAGSTRAQSFNRRLAQVAAQLATQVGAEVTLLELGTLDIPLYNADLEAEGTLPDVIRLKQLMLDHPGWVICSPEYNGSYTALLKNTLDWGLQPSPKRPRVAPWHAVIHWQSGRPAVGLTRGTRRIAFLR